MDGSEIVTIISSVGFPAAVAVWALKEMRDLGKQISEVHTKHELAYVELVKDTTGAIKGNTEALNDLKDLIERIRP